jgi:tryptophan synthase alpha chain
VSNRIDQCFRELRDAGRCALIPFITAGDPMPGATVPLMHAMVAAGADVLELGVPFSDPMADGPVIQASSERAIGKGISLEIVLSMVAEFRCEDARTPVVLMGYMNPIERMGYASLATAAGQAGVDALLIVDCPPEEATVLQSQLADNDVYQIHLVAPTTTTARCKVICDSAQGFVYYVALKGVTGAAAAESAASAEKIAMIRANTDLPVAIGFGIKDGGSAALAAQLADAVVVGSALVDKLVNCDSIDAACRTAEAFVAGLRLGIDNKGEAVAC